MNCFSTWGCNHTKNCFLKKLIKVKSLQSLTVLWIHYVTHRSNVAIVNFFLLYPRKCRKFRVMLSPGSNVRTATAWCMISSALCSTLCLDFESSFRCLWGSSLHCQMNEKKWNGLSCVSKCIFLDPQISVVEMGTDCKECPDVFWPSFLVWLGTRSEILLHFSVRLGGQKFWPEMGTLVMMKT